jgi:FkbM family methyltransferase
MTPFSGKKLGKLPLISGFQGFFYGRFRPTGLTLIEVQGSKMYIDTQDIGVAPYLLLWGVYEKNETAVFQKIVKQGMTVVDVGANIGYYTLMAAQLVGDTGTVFAFEPDKRNFEILSRNVALNGCSNVILVPKAVSAKSGRERLFVDKNNLGGHSLSKTNVNVDSVLMVEVTSLDEFFEKTRKEIDVIKLDIQGLEMNALRGMEKTIKNSWNLVILSELWPNGLKNAGSSAEEFLEKLRQYGFEIFLIGEKLEPIRRDQWTNTLNPNEPIGLLCRKQEKRVSRLSQ